LYNRKKNYFSSVIITKETDYGDVFWNKHVDRDHIVVSLQEARNATFFQIEYFIRTFMISSFKTTTIFRDFNEQIVDTLKKIMYELESKNKYTIPVMILDLINYIARNYQANGVTYNEIDEASLDIFSID